MPGNTRWAIGIDPGLDLTGVALVLQASKAGGGGVQRTLVHAVQSVRTKPSEEMGRRLLRLYDGIQRTVQGFREATGWDEQLVVVLEVPTHTGRSRQMKRKGGEHINSADMSRFWQALGVIRLAIENLPITQPLLVERAPGTIPKKDRHALFARYLGEAENDDERDACIVALAHLLEGETVAELARRSVR